MDQGFPGFLARLHDDAGDPGKPQNDPESPHRMEMKWKWLLPMGWFEDLDTDSPDALVASVTPPPTLSA
jgi:hypothetical protein